MTREEQIKEAADHIAGSSDHPFLAIEDAAKKDGFALGARWADSHPQQNWHKYPEEKPKVDDDYIVYLDAPGFCPIIEIYDYSEEYEEFGYFHMSGEGEKIKWISIDNCVKAWKELPQPPKFD